MNETKAILSMYILEKTDIARCLKKLGIDLENKYVWQKMSLVFTARSLLYYGTLS